MRKVADRGCREARYTHFMFNIFFNNFFTFGNHVVYEIMWENTVQPGRPQTTRRRMRIACWTAKAINTHS